MLERYIDTLTKELELEVSLATQVPGVYNFPLDEDISILITEKAPGFNLHCDLYATPSHQNEEFFGRLLLGNLFGQGTKGAVLALNDDGTKVILNQDVSHHVEYKEFKDILEDFVNTVDYWRMEAKSYR